MPTGLEVYDETGRVLVNMDSSVLRIIHAFNSVQFRQYIQNQPPLHVPIISCFVDLDRHANEPLYTQGTAQQLYDYAEVILIGVFNVTN